MKSELSFTVTTRFLGRYISDLICNSRRINIRVGLCSFQTVQQTMTQCHYCRSADQLKISMLAQRKKFHLMHGTSAFFCAKSADNVGVAATGDFHRTSFAGTQVGDNYTGDYRNVPGPTNRVQIYDREEGFSREISCRPDRSSDR